MKQKTSPYNWRETTYLAEGTPNQRQAHAVLNTCGVLNLLAPFDPAVVSTICVDLDIPGSDLDIICQVPNQEAFATAVSPLMTFPGFELKSGLHSVARFHSGLTVEIYASQIPTEQQNGWRHLTQMARLLALGGNSLRSRIRSLKIQGYKTEPAFARVLGLVGDPYAAFLDLEHKTSSEIELILRSVL